MNPKQLLRLVLIFALALAVWGALALSRQVGRDQDAGLRLPAVTMAQADTVFLAHSADTIILTRQGSDSTWLVNGFAASTPEVKGLFQALEDTAETGELIAQSGGSHQRLGVDSAAGKRLRVSGGGKILADLVLGNRGADYQGVYVRRAGEDRVYLLHGPLSDMADRTRDDWRDKRVAQVEPESVATIDVVRGKRSYHLRRTGNSWSLGSGGAADSAGVMRLLAQYRDLSADGFATAAQADSAGFAQPDRQVRMLSEGGRALLSLALDSTAGGFWTRRDSASTVYRLDQWHADLLTPAESTLVKKKEPAGRKP